MQQHKPICSNDLVGWASPFPVFESASLDEVVNSLSAFVRGVTPEQMRAWKTSVPLLQAQCTKVGELVSDAVYYGAVLEYKMPDGPHRVDAILLVSGAVLVLELKGDGWHPTYVEQAADYARRLYWFHTCCGQENVRVHTILVSYGRRINEVAAEWHTETNVERLADVVRRFDQPGQFRPIDFRRFVEPGVCQPSLSLVQAARRFFADHALPHIKRIDDVTSAALARLITEISSAHSASARKLILVSGVPGAGKTYVGLKIAHEPFLDELAEKRENGEKPTAPAVFLSGNGPLVEVLQYELKRAGGGGKVFVRGVKEFVARFSKPKSPPPPHHVLIFDEAQRAWDEKRVREKHGDRDATSEPEAFVRFSERIPKWSVVVGLIGEGQEIHIGEEGGIDLWIKAIKGRENGWEVVGPDRYQAAFASEGVAYRSLPELHLAQSVRFNFAAGLSDWAAELVNDGANVKNLARISGELRQQGYQLRVTRNLGSAQEFLWSKYREVPDARFGMVVSSRDKELGEYGVTPASRFMKIGAWYADPDTSPSSCRRLQDAITEFSAQGLELDHTLLVWGGDFAYSGAGWDISAAKKYQSKTAVKSPLQLRRNAYRVLLTRGREGVLICVPQGMKRLDATFELLVAAGCEVL